LAVFFSYMVASLMLLIGGICEISVADILNPFALARGAALNFPTSQFPISVPRPQLQAQRGINKAKTPEVSKQNGPRQSWHAHKSRVQKKIIATRSRRGRSGHSSPVMNMAFESFEDVEAALSDLVPLNADDLQGLRAEVSSLKRKLEDAINKEDYQEAARLRNEVGELLRKDPAVLRSSLRQSMKKAIEAEQYARASRYRDQLNILKRYQLEFLLAGLWKGESLTEGEISVRIDYDGDTLLATDLDGEARFTADVSEARYLPGKRFIEGRDCFAAEGKIAGKEVKGEMCVLGGEAIGFLYLGGGTGGVVRMLGAGGKPIELNGFDKGYDGEFVIFKKTGPLDKPKAPSVTERIARVAGLEKLLDQDGSDKD